MPSGTGGGAGRSGLGGSGVVALCTVLRPGEDVLGEHRPGPAHEQTRFLAGGVEHQTQRVVTVQDRLQGTREGVTVQGDSGVQHDPLRVGGQRAVVRRGRELGAHHRRERHAPHGEVHVGAGGGRGVVGRLPRAVLGPGGRERGEVRVRGRGPRGHHGQGRPVEQVLGGDVQARAVGGTHHAQRADAVPALGDEVTVQGHGGGARPAAAAEHLGDHAREHLLRGGPCLAGVLLRVRRGQGGAVHLAADRHGERVEHHHVGGHQVRRRAACQVLAHGSGLQAGTARGHHVRHEAGVLVTALDPDHGPGDPGDLVQQRLHLGGLHALTADLHLVVRAAQQQVAHAGLPAGEVARAVQAAARCEGVGDEARGRLDRVGPVAAGELRAAQVELSRLTVRHGLQIGVQQVGGEAGQGPPDRGGLPGHRRRHGVHRGLGGPVEVPGELPRRHDVVPQGRGQRLAAQDQRAGRGQLQQPELHEHPGQRWRGVQDVDPVLRERVQEGEGVPRDGGVVDVNRVPAEQPRKLVEGGVEGEGRGVRHVQVRALRTLLGRREEQRPVVCDEMAERGAGHLHALGPPGGSGGVQQVGEVLRPGGVRGLGRGGRPVDLLPQDPTRIRAQGGVAVRVRDDDVRAAVLSRRTTPLGRVRAVQRLERAAREQRREHAQDHLVAARQVQHHDVLGPHPRLHQKSREHAGPVHELRAGERRAGVHEHGLVRAAEPDLLDGLRQVHGREGLVGRRGVGRRPPTMLQSFQVFRLQRGHRPQAGRVLREESAQQGDEPPQPGERAVTGHPGRVRLEAQLDLGALLGGQRRDREAHVLGRAACHVAQQPRDAVEVQRGVEDLHVGAHPVQQATGAGHPEGAGQVLAAEALVLAHAHHGGGDL